MLRPKHLAIVRAALTYWDEEMGAASNDVYRHYLHSRDREAVFTPWDVIAVRAYFNEVVHKYGLLDVDSGSLSSTTLVEDSHNLIPDANQQIVSVLTR